MKRKIFEKKNILIIAVMILGVALCLWLIGSRDVSETFVSAKAINQKVNLDDVFAEIDKIYFGDNESINQDAEVGEIQNEEIIPIDAPEDEIDFGKYESLERRAIVNTNNNKIDEVWMIKLSELEQQEDIFRIFGNRIQKLKNGSEENEERAIVLSNAVIKQEDGIVIMIASDKVIELEKTIAREME